MLCSKYFPNINAVYLHNNPPKNLILPSPLIRCGITHREVKGPVGSWDLNPKEPDSGVHTLKPTMLDSRLCRALPFHLFCTQCGVSFISLNCWWIWCPGILGPSVSLLPSWSVFPGLGWLSNLTSPPMWPACRAHPSVMFLFSTPAYIRASLCRILTLVVSFFPFLFF